jgi:hypothetical protein
MLYPPSSVFSHSTIRNRDIGGDIDELDAGQAS